MLNSIAFEKFWPMNCSLEWYRAGPYAVTEEYTVTFSDGGVGAYGYVTNSISETVVPEPASMALLGVGPFRFGLMKRRRAS